MISSGSGTIYYLELVPIHTYWDQSLTKAFPHHKYWQRRSKKSNVISRVYILMKLFLQYKLSSTSFKKFFRLEINWALFYKKKCRVKFKFNMYNISNCIVWQCLIWLSLTQIWFDYNKKLKIQILIYFTWFTLFTVLLPLYITHSQVLYFSQTKTITCCKIDLISID